MNQNANLEAHGLLSIVAPRDCFVSELVVAGETRLWGVARLWSGELRGPVRRLGSDGARLCGIAPLAGNAVSDDGARGTCLGDVHVGDGTLRKSSALKRLNSAGCRLS